MKELSKKQLRSEKRAAFMRKHRDIILLICAIGCTIGVLLSIALAIYAKHIVIYIVAAFTVLYAYLFFSQYIDYLKSKKKKD